MTNKFLKLCSLVLAVVMLVNMLPMESFAAELAAEDTVVAAPVEQEKVQTTAESAPEEIIESRTQYTKEFSLGNGLYMAMVYPDAVHYETEDGWKEIDNTLVAKRDGTYTNTAGVWDVSFPQQLSGAKSVTITKDGYTLSFCMAGELRSSGTAAVQSRGVEQLLKSSSPD